MSDMGFSGQVEAASWLGTLSSPERAPVFTPWQSPENPDAQAAEVPTASTEVPVIDLAAIRAESFAQGFEEGRRTVELEIAAEREALGRLAETLKSLRPEPTNALAALLAETVERLARQIVGEVEVDPALLQHRAEAAAALIGEEVGPNKLHVHPDDIGFLDAARIPVQIVGDATLARGSVLLECASGWVEDGPAVRLDRLRTALDRLGAAE